MNDRQNPYDPYYQQQPQLVGYDEYGQPVYQQAGPAGPQSYDAYDPYAPPQTQQPQQSHDPHQPQQTGQGYGTGQDYGADQGFGTGQGYGYDAYGPSPQSHQAQPQAYDPYAGQGAGQTYQPQNPPQSGQQTYDGYGVQDGQDAYGHGYESGRQSAAVDTAEQWNIPQQAAAPPQQADGYPGRQAAEQPEAPAPASERAAREPATDSATEPEPTVPGQRRPEYRTEQFSFIEEPDEDSEDVIDWLKFTESRSERREEARRRGRNRLVALIVVAALVVVGGVGYLWSAGKLPGTSDAEQDSTASAGPQRRDVIVVHLHDTKKGGTSTALLVDNVTAKQGATVLLPNSLAISDDEGATTTLGKSVEADGATGTRESIDTLLGTRIGGTWRLDTPYLESLVDLVGNIDVDTDTDVPDGKKGASPLVHKGEAQTLSGRMAVGYATYRAPGEDEAKQLERFGTVLRGVLRKISDDPKAATVTVQTLAQILDPSLSEKDLGAALAKLAHHAKVGDYKTELLPVGADGTPDDATAKGVVKDVLGGVVKAPEAGTAVRIGIKNGTGDEGAAESARVKLVNGGYAFVGGGTAGTAAQSEVVYKDAAAKETATQVAKTLGLPESAVKQGSPTTTTDVSVLLGQDYRAK